MHLETREKSVSKKCYLTHSFRDSSGRVRKDRVFLGTNLSNEELAARSKNAQAELKRRITKVKAIRDPFIIVLSFFELKEPVTLDARGELHLRHLSETDWTKFRKVFTYDTNVI